LDPVTFKSSSFDKILEVSYDGINYIDYKTLVENPGEPKIKATNSNVLLITYNFSAILPVPP
jgi:hypothetical protein